METQTQETTHADGSPFARPTGYVPDKERCALAKAFLELPKELKTNPQVVGAFRTGFRLGWHAREKGA